MATSGDEIFHPKLIAINYAKSAIFWVDIISTFPFELLGFSGTLQKIVSLLGVLKVVRIGKISKIIANLNVSTQLKASI